MKMPSKGVPVYVEGYGRGIFAGGVRLDEPDEASVMLKFEGDPRLEEGYGRGIIDVPLDEFKENRVYPEQCSGTPSVSTEKRDAVFEERFK